MTTVVFDPLDPTCGIQTAINIGSESAYKEVFVPYVGQDYVIDSPTDPNSENEFLALPAIQLRSNLRLVLDPRVRLYAKSGSFHGKYTHLVGGRNIQNVQIVGNSWATFKMRKSEYTLGNGYSVSEFRHIFRFDGCHNVWLDGIKMEDSGGDNIILDKYDPLGTLVDSSSFKITNVISTGAYRNSFSILSVLGLECLDSTFKDTAGTQPQAGLDIEPEDFGESVSGVVFRRCTFSNGPSRPVVINWESATAMPIQVSCVFDSCILEGANNTSYGLDLVHLTPTIGPPEGSYVRFQNCTIRNNAYATRIKIDKAAKCKYEFIGCTFEKGAFLNDPFDIAGATAPIEFVLLGSEPASPVPARVTFSDSCIIKESLFDRQAVLESGGTSRIVSGAILYQKAGQNNTVQAVANLPLLTITQYQPSLETRVNTTGVVEPVLKPRYLDSKNRVI